MHQGHLPSNLAGCRLSSSKLMSWKFSDGSLST
jgi:hypothetical protein